MSRIFYKQKKEDHEQDTDRLFDKLACRGELCSLHTEAVAADTAVDRSARQSVGDNDQKFGTSGIAEESLCDEDSIFLDQQDFRQRQEESQAEGDAEYVAGRFFLSP